MDVFDLSAVLRLDSSDYERGLGEAEESAGSFGSSVGNVLKGIGIAALAKGAADGIISIGKAAVSSYANYEQLAGGVSKLFGDSNQIVMKNAAKAYKTTGMSANEYMEQVTSFSAALVNSLGGDTAAAADKADVAMRAISDNVNTFGTDMGSVQNAFQGFAKQNYTMLDNLNTMGALAA